jgi:hypothetical protein
MEEQERSEEGEGNGRGWRKENKEKEVERRRRGGNGWEEGGIWRGRGNRRGGWRVDEGREKGANIRIERAKRREKGGKRERK